MPDIHFHDLFSDFSENCFSGLPTEYIGHNRTVSIRTMEAQLTKTILHSWLYWKMPLREESNSLPCLGILVMMDSLLI
jgi:hypothetical protein